MKSEKYKYCDEKRLGKVCGGENRDPLNLVYQWIKSGLINLNEFKQLLEAREEYLKEQRKLDG